MLVVVMFRCANTVKNARSEVPSKAVAYLIKNELLSIKKGLHQHKDM